MKRRLPAWAVMPAVLAAAVAGLLMSAVLSGGKSPSPPAAPPAGPPVAVGEAMAALNEARRDGRLELAGSDTPAAQADAGTRLARAHAAAAAELRDAARGRAADTVAALGRLAAAYRGLAAAARDGDAAAYRRASDTLGAHERQLAASLRALE